MEALSFPHALPVGLSHLFPVLHLQSENSDSLVAELLEPINPTPGGVVGALES